MSVFDQARELAQAGRAREGIDLICRAADDGDPDALLALANWRLWGMYGPRDLAQCHALLARAAAGGSIEAARLRATLTGNGTGVRSDVAAATQMLRDLAPRDADSARQLALLDAMAGAAPVAALGVDELSPDPEIRIVRGLLGIAQCDYLMAKARPGLQASRVVDDRTGQPRPDPVRTSSGMAFDPAQEDLVVHMINRRVAEATVTPVSSGEMLHILHYAPGQEYRPHLDALPGAGNQRHLTALIYLNDGYDGGETAFVDLGIKARGRQGDCLIFRNAQADGRADPRTRHAGLPVTGGAKWLASRWIRQGAYDPFAGP